MKVSTRTFLDRNDGQLSAEFSAEGYFEHRGLPGIVDLAEYLDLLKLEEKGILDKEGHRVPVTILSLGVIPVSLDGVESYMKTRVDGPFHAAWTAGEDKLEFMVASTEIEGMKALRKIYHAANEGTVFAGRSERHFWGLRLVAIEKSS